jgi:hypothetical protein
MTVLIFVVIREKKQDMSGEKKKLYQERKAKERA